MNDTTLEVSEQFYSIQGEGRYAGTPAVFLRTASCNFLCGGFKASERHTDKEYGETVSAMAEAQARTRGDWVCDTISEWMTGTDRSISDLYNQWTKNGFADKIKQGAHLIITGGEPMMHQQKLNEFLDRFAGSIEPFIEVETNGSILAEDRFESVVNLFNISPKLANSGLKKDVRYCPDVISYFVDNTNSDFKFVVNGVDSWKEIQNDYLNPFNIPRENIYLMPAGQTKKDLRKNRKAVVQLAMKHGVNYSDRLQIVTWNETTGV